MKKSKNILMIVEGSYPQDIRVRKESESLVNLGYSVHVISVLKEGQKQEELINGVSVSRISGYSHTVKGVFGVLTAIFGINFFFFFKLKKWAKDFKGLVIVHDLPLSLTVLKRFKHKDQKVLIDMHENYPEALKTWFAWRKSIIIRIKNSLFFNPNLWLKIEEKAMRKIDGLIVVVDEMKDNIKKKYPKFNKPVTIVSNYESKSFRNEIPKEASESDYLDSSRFNVSYVGGIGPHRGLDTAIKGMAVIVKDFPSMHLSIFGSGNPDNINYLKNLVKELKLGQNVHFFGQVPFSECNRIMISSDLNIIPHNSDDHTNNTIPHKLFQILMMKKPILVSSCKPLKRIVSDLDVGYVFEASNENSFAKEVKWISENYQEALVKSEKGFDVTYQGECNWEAQEETMNNFLNQF